MFLSYDGIDVSSIEKGKAVTDFNQPNDLEALAKFLSDDYNGNRVVVDCSASQAAPENPESRGESQGARRKHQRT